MRLAVVLSACDASAPETTAESVAALPELAVCDEVRGWNEDLVDLEQAMVEALNAHRADGRVCGSRGSFAPAPPLIVNGALTCAARRHALDMASRGFVDQSGSDDSTPWDRIRDAEYRFATADQTVVATDLAPAELLDTLWLPREGSCAALSATAYTDVGVGVALPFDDDDALAGRRWTVVVARPLESHGLVVGRRAATIGSGP